MTPRNRFMAFVVFLLIGVTIPAAMGSDPVVKDLRKGKDGSKLIIAFCARDVAPGHVFIVLGKDDEKNQLCSVEAFGFYPKEGKGIVGAVPGEVANEFLKKGVPAGSCRLILRVNKEQYGAVDRVRRKWANAKYKLLTADCVSFSKEAAQALHLQLPDDAERPQVFLDRLIQKNKE